MKNNSSLRFIPIILLISTFIFTKNIYSKIEMVIQSEHSGSINSIAIDKNDKFLYSASFNEIKIWNYKTGGLAKTLNVLTDLYSMTLHPNGKYLITGSYGKLEYRDIKTGKLVKTLRKSEFISDKLKIDPSGNYLISIENEKFIKIWDLKTDQCARTINGDRHFVTDYVFSPDGKYILTVGFSNDINVFDLKTGKLVKEIYIGEEGTNIENVAIDSKGETIVASQYQRIYVIDFYTGKQKMMITQSENISSLAIDPENKYILSPTKGGIIFWDIRNGNIAQQSINPYGKKFVFNNAKTAVITGVEGTHLNEVNLNNPSSTRNFGIDPDFHRVTFLHTDETILMTCDDYEVYFWDIESGALIDRFDPEQVSREGVFRGGLHSIALSDDKKQFLTADKSSIKIWNYKTKKLIKKFNVTDYKNGHGHDGCGYVIVDPLFKYAVTYGKDIILWNILTGEFITKVSDRSYGFFLIDPTNNFLVHMRYGNNVEIRKLNNLELVTSFNLPRSGFASMSFDFSGKYLVFETEGKAFDVYNFEDKKWEKGSESYLKDLTGFKTSQNKYYKNKGSVFWNIYSQNSAIFEKDQFGLLSRSGKLIISSNPDKSLQITNSCSQKSFKLLSSSNDWVMFNDEGYFDASRYGGKLVSMSNENLEVFSIDQFAIKNNRPDLILKYIGVSDNLTIEHFKQQYQRRLRKLGLTEDQLSSDLHAPDAKIKNITTSFNFSEISFSLTDTKYDLNSYNIYVNDVPVYGSDGKKIEGKSIELSENVEITQGNNKIEISCMNSKGVESYRAYTYADYKELKKSALYLLSFGVSDYKDNALDLKYAAKDAEDISEAFSKLNSKQFSNVYSQVFTNNDVTIDNIKNAMSFQMLNARPNDFFVLFIAGHGIHDNDPENTYYFLTHESDLNDLKNTAANFELIEDILDGIPPRNKLFLMDTCESGELEDGDINVYASADGSRGLKSRGIKINNTNNFKSKPSTDRYIYEKNRYIYNDLARRTGAIVFSSSRGGELSYERDDIQNGLFTEELINCLKSSDADTDNDGIISTEELRIFVGKKVAEQSGGLQHPTIDRDNIYQKFGFKSSK